MRSVYIGLIGLVATTVAALGQNSVVMKFEAHPPHDLVRSTMGAHGWIMFATGPVDRNAGQRLKDLIEQKGIPSLSRLYLHSPGGSIEGGFKLGSVIRAHRLITNIGQLDPKSPTKTGLPGECLNACALAFLGGPFRYVDGDSSFGFQRAFGDDGTDSASTAQLPGALDDYFRTMGVDTELFTLASQLASSRTLKPASDVLERLNVVNNGATSTKWTIESTAQGLYLNGERDTDNGVNKVMLLCPTGEPMLINFVFDSGMNAEDVMGFPIASLFLDSKPISLAGRQVSRQNRQGIISVAYRADAAMVEAIAGAKTIGIGLIRDAQLGLFAGFDRMPLDVTAAILMSAFPPVCEKSGGAK
jgi:hypothetical protein